MELVQRFPGYPDRDPGHICCDVVCEGGLSDCGSEHFGASIVNHRAVSMALMGGGVVLFLDLLFYGGPGDAGWLHHLRKAAVFGLIFFVWGLLPESDDDDRPGKPEPELSEAPFVAAPKTRARVGLVSLALLFSGMLLWSIAVVLGFSEGGTVAFHLVFSTLSLWFIAACLNDAMYCASQLVRQRLRFIV